MLWDISLPFVTGEFGIVYRARLTRSILSEIVAVKTIKGKGTINYGVIYMSTTSKCLPAVYYFGSDPEALNNNIVTIKACFLLFCHSKFSCTKTPSYVFGAKCTNDPNIITACRPNYAIH